MINYKFINVLVSNYISDHEITDVLNVYNILMIIKFVRKNDIKIFENRRGKISTHYVTNIFLIGFYRLLSICT